MKATYKISEKDYISATILGARLSFNMLGIILLTSLIIIICLLVLVILPINIQTLISISLGMIGGMFFLVLLHPILIFFVAKLSYKKYPIIRNSEFSIEETEEGVIIETNISKTNLGWKNILKWRENKKFILLFISPRQFFVVPKILSEQGFNIDLLRKNLSQHVGKQ